MGADWGQDTWELGDVRTHKRLFANLLMRAMKRQIRECRTKQMLPPASDAAAFD